MENLSEKKCVPCEGGVAPFTREQSSRYLEELPEWQAIADKKIVRDFAFQNFKEALEFVNEVGDIAEANGHHPDIFLHDYKNVSITLSTHAIGGLSENDFILAAKINKILS